MPGLDVLDESIAGRPGVHDYDPLRLAIDVRGTGATGYELAAAVAEDDIIFELYGENVVVAVFGMAEHVGPQVERLVAALRARASSAWTCRATASTSRSRRRPRGASSR